MDLKYNEKIEVQDLNKFWVAGEEFSGITYQGLLSVNTKTYVVEPVRTDDGSMPNIEDYDTFIVPQVKFSLKYFSIGDYQRLCARVNSSNQFPVKYWDKQFGTFMTYMMYMKPEQMTKLYNVRTSVFGVLDYELEFVGTLNNLEEYIVVYDGNGGTLTNYKGQYNSSTTYKKGDRVSLDNDYYEAIWEDNKFSKKYLTDSDYWQSKSYSEFNLSTTYQKDSIVYKNINGGKEWYVAIYNGSFSDRELSNTNYWKPISVKEYGFNNTYYYGDYVMALSMLYQAIYYNDSFSGIDPTITSHWNKMPIYNGQSIKWGNSILIQPIENLFDAPNNNVHFVGWKTANNMWYYPNQRANIFSNLVLVAQWE